MPSPKNRCASLVVIASIAASGCGSTGHSSSVSAGAASTPAVPASSGATSTATSGGGSNAAAPGALSGEAQSAATGDIPDNQVFLVFHNHRGGYSIKYPEGWTQQGRGASVTFKDKNNLVHIFISRGGAPSAASVSAQLSALQKTTPTLDFSAPHSMQLGSSASVRATYTTQSAPNPVTGKRVTLIVDRYEEAHNGRIAVVDLGTPKGVDNVDAYRMMIQSFTWR
jgi:hypothetical protein